MNYLIDWAALTLLYCLVFFKKWRAEGREALLVNTLMYLYLSVVLFCTLMPVLTSLPSILSHSYAPMNMIPFIDVLEGYGDFLRQIILNILMTVPFGFLFPLTQNRRGRFFKTVACCFMMSLAIELLQPLINDYRSSDITDLITNTIGGAIGYVCYRIFRPITFAVLDWAEGKKE